MVHVSDIIEAALLATGGILLSVLAVTVSISERLHRRDPIFNNFLYTWILFSAAGVSRELAAIHGDDLGNLNRAQRGALLIMVEASTLNLSIHLWFTLRSGTLPSSPRSEKLRTLFLLVNPYILGAMAFPLLLFIISTGALLVAICYIAMDLMTLVINFTLLIKYLRYNHKMRNTPLAGVLSISFFFRLLAFALYQLAYNCVFVLGAALSTTSSPSTAGWLSIINIANGSFPLLAFCVLGLHTDIMNLWFPCLRKRASPQQARQVDKGSAGNDNDVRQDEDEMKILIGRHEDEGPTLDIS